MRIALEDLRLDQLIVIYAGSKPCSLAANLEVVLAATVAGLVA